jgi:hypothetical protein
MVKVPFSTLERDMTHDPSRDGETGIPVRPRNGYVLLIVPVILLGIAMLATQMARRSQVSMRIAGAEMDHVQTRLCSERMNAVEVDRAVRTLESGSEILEGRRTSECGAAGMEAVRCTTDVLETNSSLTRGCYDLSNYETLMPLRSLCRNGSGNSSLLEANVRLSEIPLYQFAAYYDGYMEVYPGPDMTFNGRVHANDTIAFWNEYKVSFGNWITSAGAIIGKRRTEGRLAFAKADGSGIDDVNIMNLAGATYSEVKNFAADWPDFKAKHRVAYANEANGCGPVPKLALKNLKGLDPRSLIDWRQAGDDADAKKLKYAWRANLIWQNGNWRNNSLAVVFPPVPPLLTPPGPPAWTPSPYPQRVKVNVRAENLVTHLLPINLGNLLQRSPDDTIVYLYDEFYDILQGNRMAGGFLLYNCANLTRKLTIATNSRIMVYGDFNTLANYNLPGGGPKGYFPSALVCDHYISLSNEFIPSEHDSPGEGRGPSVIVRNPGARLIVNTCLTVGGTRLPSGHWQAVHLLPQHIEYLENVPVTFSGSLACLFTSRWVSQIGGASDYYAPNRNFAFDPMYNDMRNMPPGTPRLVTPALSEWQLVRD